MSYSPTTWQNGDTITAAKLNNMESGITAGENGWEVTSSTTQLYSGSLTVSNGGDSVGVSSEISSALSSASTATVTVDGTSYDLTGFNDGGYWTFGAPFGDFSTYSFSVYIDSGTTYFCHQTAGTYAVTIATLSQTITTTSDFQSAILSIGALPLLCVSGTTTAAQMTAAQSAGRLMYFMHEGCYCLITSYDGSHVSYVSDSSVTVTASIVSNVFTVTA